KVDVIDAAVELVVEPVEVLVDLISVDGHHVVHEGVRLLNEPHSILPSVSARAGASARATGPVRAGECPTEGRGRPHTAAMAQSLSAAGSVSTPPAPKWNAPIPHHLALDRIESSRSWHRRGCTN